MKNHFVLTLISLSISLSVVAQKGVYTTTNSLVNFVSDAPLEVIRASSTQLRGILDPDKKSFAFVIPSNSFQGFNNPLQQVHFYESYIEASRYPEASFKGRIIEQINFDQNGEYEVRAKGALTIHGVEQERILQVKLKIINGIIHATSDFSIMLQEYNITIPKVVNQKISEEVFIHVRSELARK